MGRRYSSGALLEHVAHFQTASTCHISERPRRHPSTWSAKNILLGPPSKLVIVGLNDFHKLLHGFLVTHTLHHQSPSNLGRVEKNSSYTARHL